MLYRHLFTNILYTNLTGISLIGNQYLAIQIKIYAKIIL